MGDKVRERLNKIFFSSLKAIAAVFSAIAIVAISTIIVLNSLWLYGIMIDKYNLTSATGLSKDTLVKNYNGLVNYLQNPFIKKLSFPDFIMSVNGEIHFYEVKRIFIMLIIIALIFVVSAWIFIIMRKYNKNINKNGLINTLNLASNFLGVFFIGIVTLYFINFSWAFTMFHKIFFRNDYWIFDPILDPVINALPEELFMVMGGIILGIILSVVAVIKWRYYRSRNIKVEVEMNNKHIT